MITSSVPDGQGLAFSAAGLPCFFCARTLADPAVHWRGATGDLYLHAACVSLLIICLARDVHEIAMVEWSEARGETAENPPTQLAGPKG